MKFIMLMINIGVYNHPSKHFAIEGRKVVVALDAFVVRSVASSGRMLYGHGDGEGFKEVAGCESICGARCG